MGPIVTLKDQYDIAMASTLPVVTSKMLQNYFLKAENLENAAEEEFDDRNVGYVQLLRKDDKCTVDGKIVAEIESIPDYFPQVVTVNEKNKCIETVLCDRCDKDACMHALAFLFWMHRKTQPKVRLGDKDVCFWVESLVEYELGYTVVPIKQLIQTDVDEPKFISTPDTDSFLKDVVQLIKDKSVTCPFGRYACKKKKFGLTSVHELILDATKNRYSWEQFYKMASEALTTEECKKIREKTKYRYNDPSLYLEMRYGRISSSKVYDCMSKEMPIDKLYNTIMGFHKETDTTEINRKRRIELNVRQQLEFFAKCQYENPGLFIDPEFPLIIAIPDGICENHIVEIKCPTTEAEMSRYIAEGEELAPKYYTEMQVQMYVSGKDASVVCVADPKFEENKNIYIQTVSLDREYAKNVMKKAQEYWRNIIFPYELTKWCVEREDASKGGLPSLDGLSELDPKREKVEDITISETQLANGNDTNGHEKENGNGPVEKMDTTTNETTADN